MDSNGDDSIVPDTGQKKQFFCAVNPVGLVTSCSKAMPALQSFSNSNLSHGIMSEFTMACCAALDMAGAGVQVSSPKLQLKLLLANWQ